MLILDLFFNIFIIIFFLLRTKDNVIIVIVIFILLEINFNYLKNYYSLKKYLKSQTDEKIKILEKDLSNKKMVYDRWYLTDEYMFSVKETKKVNYQDILVVEGGICLVGGSQNTIGYKQKIYLKNGETYKLRDRLVSSDSNSFEELIRKKNPNVYFGLMEDYQKSKVKL